MNAPKTCDYCEREAEGYVCTAGGEEILAYYCEQHRDKVAKEFDHRSFEHQPVPKARG